jgi:hypothetical protein
MTVGRGPHGIRESSSRRSLSDAVPVAGIEDCECLVPPKLDDAPAVTPDFVAGERSELGGKFGCGLVSVVLSEACVAADIGNQECLDFPSAVIIARVRCAMHIHLFHYRSALVRERALAYRACRAHTTLSRAQLLCGFAILRE